jgi:flagellar biogenesis protein FliO
LQQTKTEKHKSMKTKISNKTEAGFTLSEIAMLGAIICQLALLAGVIWIAWHFISKWW